MDRLPIYTNIHIQMLQLESYIHREGLPQNYFGAFDLLLAIPKSHLFVTY